MVLFHLLHNLILFVQFDFYILLLYSIQILVVLILCNYIIVYLLGHRVIIVSNTSSILLVFFHLLLFYHYDNLFYFILFFLSFFIYQFLFIFIIKVLFNFVQLHVLSSFPNLSYFNHHFMVQLLLLYFNIFLSEIHCRIPNLILHQISRNFHPTILIFTLLPVKFYLFILYIIS